MQDVSKHFRSIPAVSGISFEARAGEVTGYLGPNVSGKSITMKMITGLLDPTGGVILFDGRPIERDLDAYTSAWATSLRASFLWPPERPRVPYYDRPIAQSAPKAHRRSC